MYPRLYLTIVFCLSFLFSSPSFSETYECQASDPEGNYLDYLNEFAELVDDLLQRGVQWFRIELLEEESDQVREIVALYDKLLKRQITGQEVWKKLRAANRVGVTRGTLESKRNPLAIL